MAIQHFISACLALVLLTAAARPAAAQANQQAGADDIVLQAREALRKQDAAQLALARQAINRAGHPLAQWVEYWELGNRLATAQQAELEAFYTRWSGSYVEDRLRNDWLLELGKRRDWANLRTDFARFRMNDDREVSCYALLAQHLEGQDVRIAARAAWSAQRDLDQGCNLLATTLREARQLSDADIWQRAREAVEANRPRAARAALLLVRPGLEGSLREWWDKPEQYLTRRPQPNALNSAELDLLVMMRLAAKDADLGASQLESGWEARLPPLLAATAWAHTAKQAALNRSAAAAEHARRAWKLWDGAAKPGAVPPWSDELLAWHVRAALRAPPGDKRRWALMLRAIDAMSPGEQKDSAWVYWRARAVLAGVGSDAEAVAARQALAQLAPQMSFYGKLAAEALGQRISLPAAPAALSEAERESARRQGGFKRALQLIALGLRSEGVREWNFTLRGLGDRELLAASQLACDQEVWDRCINTSERTRTEVDLAQRFPTPHRELIEAKAREVGVDTAIVYGLIRQESRFITDARSGVGASGLMQLMPATARWTAKQVGLNYSNSMINDREVNLQLGMAYFKRVLDDFDGSLAMAAAGYNAGPNRPRRWREGAEMEPAAWAETIPFNETRDYVKKLLSNSVYYAAMLGQPLPTLQSRLGKAIGPRDPASRTPDKDLP